MDDSSFVSASSRRRPDHVGGDVLHTVLPGDKPDVHKYRHDIKQMKEN